MIRLPRMKIPGRGGQLTSGRDPLTPEQRQRNMSRIRGRDTKPEWLVRRALHAAGLRYRLHVSDLPGRPDLVFPARRAVVFVHGCFWHGHDCPLFRLPATRTAFWAAKIEANRVRDVVAGARLQADGWRVMIVWECALRGRARRPTEGVAQLIQAWLASPTSSGSVSGDWDRVSGA